ncbi:hypothetical protein FRC06_005545 [Ceratobasidium sp. 370]|nr:hypothetical protein FRC06_005545 [Ceratobasidium sp. 370]
MPKSTNTPHVKSFQSLDEKGRNTAYRVLEGVARSKSLVVVCGSGISVAAGIPSFRELANTEEPIPSTTIPWRKFVAMTTERKPSPAQLQTINKAMTQFRIQARQVELTPFHRFIHRKIDMGECTSCITANFDGLEARHRPDLRSRMVMLHGDNTTLACPAPGCPELNGDEVHSFDSRFLTGETVLCPSCVTASNLPRRTHAKPQLLRANVLLDGSIDPNIHVNGTWDQVLLEAEGADALLIAGTSLNTPETCALVDELVCRVRANEGAVVFINIVDYSKSRLAHLMDFSLQIDAQECASTLLAIMDQDSAETASQVWEEFSEPTLPSATFIPPPPSVDRKCCQCDLAMQDALLSCITCGSVYCYERPDEHLGSMCVVLHGLVSLPPGTPLETSIQSFECYECFDHEKPEIFPHLVRPTRFFYEYPDPETPPRLALVVYYLSQFWPDAEHTITSIVNSWGLEGWECSYKPIPLHSVDSDSGLTFEVPWIEGSYSTLVVYITHGISGDHYQITDELRATPKEFFDKTLAPIHAVVRAAKFSAAFMLTCGELYRHPHKVSEIQEWVNG